MRKIQLIFMLCLSLMFSMHAFAKGTSLDQIVAMVNDDVVTKSEFQQALSITKLQLAQQNLPIPKEAELKKQTLDQLINKKLQLQIANQAGIKITDADLDQALEKIAQQNNMTVDILLDRIAQDGMRKEEYINTMRDQMTVQRLQQQEVASRVNVTPTEIQSFMRSKVWKNNTPKEYHLQDILIGFSDNPTDEEIAGAKKRALDVVAKLHQGVPFEEAAKIEATNPNGSKGGDLGWLSNADIPSAFTDAVSHLEVKGIAPPIQTSNGFHILRLAEVRALGPVQTPDQKQAENILLQRKFEEAIQTWVSRLRSQAYISITEKV